MLIKQSHRIGEHARDALKHPATLCNTKNAPHTIHNLLTSLYGRSKPPKGGKDQDAQGTARAEAPSGHDRQCFPHCTDRDRTDRRNNTPASRQEQQRFDGPERVRSEHNTCAIPGDRAEGCCGAVGLMGRAPRYTIAKQTADRLTAEFSAPPIPVLEIAERNGVDVVFADFAEAKDSVAGFCDFEGEKLYVNDADSTSRQMFTMAHELGHWMLHREIFEADPESYPVLPRFQDPDRDNPLEKEANAFAANLLVPKRMLLPVKSAGVAALASAFGVSLTMMEFRLKSVKY